MGLSGLSFVQAQSPVEFSVIPNDASVMIPAEGGSFSYELILENHSEMDYAFNIRSEVYSIDSGALLPVRSYSYVKVPSGEIFSREVMQYVPKRLPAGNYYYLVHIEDAMNESGSPMKPAEIMFSKLSQDDDEMVSDRPVFRPIW